MLAYKLRPKLRNLGSFTVLCVGLLSSSVSFSQQELGPLPYLQSEDSPFINMDFSYFYLEDFEDNQFNVPGASYSPNWRLNANDTSNIYRDSVDGDDGSIDGNGQDGANFFSNYAYDSLTITFDESVLGSLPSHVGIVWTDVGRNGGGTPLSHPLPVMFEFTDKNGARLDSNTVHYVGDGQITGQTGEDRFFGAVHAAGIASFTLTMPGLTNWGIDHIQYGYQSAPTAPVIISPKNAQILNAGERMVLQFRPVEGASRYFVRRFDKNSASWSYSNSRVPSKVCINDVCQIEVFGLNAQSKSIWRVRAYNGAWGAWSENGIFSVEDESFIIPEAPVLISPTARQSVPARERMTLSFWEVEGATKYYVRRYDTVSGSWSYSNPKVPSRVCRDGICQIEVFGLESQNSSIWRVRAYNASGWGAWSSNGVFRVEP